MGRQEFGRLVRRKRTEQGLSMALLGIRIGELPSGAYLDATGIRNLEEGKRAIEDDPDLFERVVAVLNMDRDEAHTALWPLPEGITLDDIQELRRDSEQITTRRMAAKAGSPRGGQDAAAGLLPDQDRTTTLYSAVSPEPVAA